MKKKDKKDLGSRLRELRKTMKISQGEMARHLEITQHSVLNYESSKRYPDARLLYLIRDKFNVNLNWLVNGDGPILFSYDTKKRAELNYLTERLQTLLKELT